MKCPSCGELINDDVAVCNHCGVNIEDKDQDIERIINSMLSDDDEGAEVVEEQKSGKVKDRILRVYDKDSGYGRGVFIVRFVTAGIVLLFLFTMLFDWFGFGGRGAFLGLSVNDENVQYKSKYMTDKSRALERGAVEALMPEEEVLAFSSFDLISYVNRYGDEYQIVDEEADKTKTSWGFRIQSIYIKGFYVVFFIALMSTALLVFDERLRTIEWNRIFSVLTLGIVMLNYISLKVPFFSMFAQKSKFILKEANEFSSVTLNMNGINVNNDFYPYKLMEHTSFFLAVGACMLWFVLTTVLIELKKEKEFE